MRTLLATVLALSAVSPALAQSSAAPAATTPSAETAAPPAGAAPAADAAPAATAPDASLSAADAGARAVRKSRFEVHRSVGFATEAVMLGALATYIVDDVMRFGGGNRMQSFSVTTLALTATAEVGMIINVLLAFTAPPRKGATPALNIVHQVLMYGGAVANIARFVLGVALLGATAENVDQGLLNAYRVTSIAAPVLFATGFTLKLF